MTTQDIIKNERTVRPSVYQEALQLAKTNTDARYYSSLGTVNVWLVRDELMVLQSDRLVPLQ